MKLLLDTHILIWAAQDKLSPEANAYILDEKNVLLFSPASLWEIVIKNSLNRPDFNIDPGLLRRGLLDNGYEELSINGLHPLMVANLPPIHKDPFDRILIAQSRVERIPFLTVDTTVAKYGGSIILVKKSDNAL
ncbi:twitching motility protein PilT [Spirochaetia bacterium]|nr:twitching motility protein PilT [Spirochaetia bacterium]